MQRQVDLAVYRTELKAQLRQTDRPLFLASLPELDAITLLTDVLDEEAQLGERSIDEVTQVRIAIGVLVVLFFATAGLALGMFFVFVGVVVTIMHSEWVQTRAYRSQPAVLRTKLWVRAQHCLAGYLDHPPRSAIVPLFNLLLLLNPIRIHNERELEARLVGYLAATLPYLSPGEARALPAVQRTFLVDALRDRVVDVHRGPTVQPPFVVAALLTLATLGDIRARPFARSLATSDPSDHVREAARDYLRALGEADLLS